MLVKDGTKNGSKEDNVTIPFSDLRNLISSQKPSDPLQLVHGQLRYTLLLPTSLHVIGTQIRDNFFVSLSAQTDEFNQKDEPSSTAELILLFMNYLVREINDARDDSDLIRPVLKAVLDQFEASFLASQEIHALAAKLPGNPEMRLSAIRIYHEVCGEFDRTSQQNESNLLRAARVGEASVIAIFGGQGNTDDYFGELKEVYTTYRHLVHDLVYRASSVLKELSTAEGITSIFGDGLDVMRWLQHPDEQPKPEYLLSAPVSFPMIGLLQLIQYALACKLLGLDPGALNHRLSGFSGHSQGILTAVMLSTATDWMSFEAIFKPTLTILFWVGVRSQQGFPRTTALDLLSSDSIEHGEGAPTPMLSVRNLPEKNLRKQISVANGYLPQNQKVHIGLVNGPRNFVVSGPPASLCGLNSHLRKIKAPTGLDQTRIPFSERKPNFTAVFLPIGAPFHSQYLQSASDQVIKDVCQFRIPAQDLRVPVLSTLDGHDLKNESEEKVNLIPKLVRLMMVDPVMWELAIGFPKATHALDFGPGRNLGIGLITHQLKEGMGLRTISACSIGNSDTNTDIGSRAELLDCNSEHSVRFGANWGQQYRPRLVKTVAGQTFLDTKFSRLLGLPPVMVAGMTPTTVSWDFVAATMNAGYHVELAGGGYHDAQSMAKAVRKIADSVVPGRSVTANLIYVSPHAISWQIPLIKSLRAEGVPIDGLTIGAGIPTLEVATEFIRGLGLRHISFKPGSIDAIFQVIKIAKANETFPVIIQWTGGRGGGHHSFEDFHQPILQSYGKIRECPNIILVAGSGFGGADDTYSYLTGNWTLEQNLSRTPMPFDGILFGSRMMTAKEAHTSKAAKQAIVDAEGADDLGWERTYQAPHGGVMTVLSEMREPIHKLATRGVRFWGELDKTIFTLDRSKRVAELQRRRDYIIKRLNADSQKVWFGKNLAGEAVDIDGMTYGEVLHRMAELFYVKHQARWVHASYQKIMTDFIHRIEERFMESSGLSLIQKDSDLPNPFILVDEVNTQFPASQKQLVNPQDADYFLALCQRRGQKPVPFVPALDENFETWFKKDSLWQSEDLEAVVDQDVGRVCILQGPVSARFSRVTDEPIKEILDTISETHVKKIKQDYYDCGEDIPEVEYFGGEALDFHDNQEVENITALSNDSMEAYHFPAPDSGIDLPDSASWFKTLAGKHSSWRRAVFSTDAIVQGKKIVPNPFKRIMAPAWNMKVHIAYPAVPHKTVITVEQQLGIEIIELRATSENEILLTLFENRNILGRNIGLPLKFTYHPEAGFAPVREVMQDRNLHIKEFYYRLWFGESRMPVDSLLTDTFDGGKVVIEPKAVANFLQSVKNHNEAYLVSNEKDHTYAPMDFAIAAGFKAVMDPLFLGVIDGDLLQVVHANNGFRMIPGMEPLKLGDVLEVSSRIDAVLIQDSGKSVQVRGVIKRGGAPVMEITSGFLYRGSYSDYENTFERKVEKPTDLHLATNKDVARLQAREWFQLTDEDMELTGQTLTFHLETLIHFRRKNSWSKVSTKGDVYLKKSGKKLVRVGTVEYVSGVSHGNPVIDYLEQHGSPIEPRSLFDQPVQLHPKTPLSIKMPASNEDYAQVSGDYNPIHVSAVFCKYVDNVGTITHGMYTSARVRGLLETWAAENDVKAVKTFNCSFIGMVLPQDQIDVKLWHIGMVSGRKIVKVEARNSSDETVLVGEAEIEQPETAFIFTGQGSQYPKMGMDLYAQSSIARGIWDRAEKHLYDQFGNSFQTLPVNKTANNCRFLNSHYREREPKRTHHPFRRRSRQSHPSELPGTRLRNYWTSRSEDFKANLQGY